MSPTDAYFVEVCAASADGRVLLAAILAHPPGLPTPARTSVWPTRGPGCRVCEWGPRSSPALAQLHRHQDLTPTGTTEPLVP